MSAKNHGRKIFYAGSVGIIALVAYVLICTSFTRDGFIRSWLGKYETPSIGKRYSIDPFFLKLSDAAVERTKHKVRYDPAYVVIPYPGGDVPSDMGVCSDEVVRAYRMVGIDIQKEVHEDMSKAFGKYPKMWRNLSPDSNIDHRRVPNLMTFFSRKGVSLPLSSDPDDYSPGDIVAWRLNNGLLHIGIVVEPTTSDGKRHLVVHNIGRGPMMEDALFIGKVIGHFQYGQRSPERARRTSG
jgi:uncharacterized protein YijF (DUF1287 family)